ncbi:MAG: hypothetical protein LBQ54_12750 [Planctomycetaceae bacterium]|jgi:hypothetical protein|nr:hypothetical protein [Planctomycetaceae bacterium]
MELSLRSNNPLLLVAGIHEQKNGKKVTMNADRTNVPGGKLPAGASRPLLTGVCERKNVAI